VTAAGLVALADAESTHSDVYAERVGQWLHVCKDGTSYTSNSEAAWYPGPAFLIRLTEENTSSPRALKRALLAPKVTVTKAPLVGAASVLGGYTLDDLPACECGHVARSHDFAGPDSLGVCYHSRKTMPTCACVKYAARGTGRGLACEARLGDVSVHGPSEAEAREALFDSLDALRLEGTR
jgi:hypothetical protein